MINDNASKNMNQLLISVLLFVTRGDLFGINLHM